MNKDELSVFLEPVVRANCDGVPIYGYGFTHVLGASPDLAVVPPLQQGNTAKPAKVPLKKSGEIGFNYLGTTATRMPRRTRNDYLPLEPIHLIDGKAETCWCSRSQAQPKAEPVWIRIDLVRETAISRIVLQTRPPAAPRNQVGSMPLDWSAVEVGMAMPRDLEIRLSRDGMTWETAYREGNDGTKTITCDTAGKRAKQIWILGTDLQRVENWLFSFSIASVEVYDEAGRNAALATNGTGVTVSSTFHSFGQTIEEQRALWPVHLDLGLKWLRIGYHDDPVNWHWVEKERGVLEVDPEADAGVTYLHERGIDFILSLGFGNRLYEGQRERKLPQLWEWYYENPEPPKSPEALAAWDRYVRYMAERFRDRVKVFEIWNEWNVSIYWGAEADLEHYVSLARRTIAILRELCPEAKIMLGSFAGFTHGLHQWDEKLKADSIMLGSVRALAGEVDLIAWHPFYQTSPEEPRRREYLKDVQAFMDYCEAHGFRGEYMATEWNYAAGYPAPQPPNWWGEFVCSEIEKAKYVARLTVLHTGLGVASFFCESYNLTYPLDLSLFRRGFGVDPITPGQPEPAYYLMRNLATALDGLKPASVQFTTEPARTDLEAITLRRPNEAVISAWTTGLARDECPGEPCDLIVEGKFREVRAYDPLNGTETVLQFSQEGNRARVPKVTLLDYPILWRFVEK